MNLLQDLGGFESQSSVDVNANRCVVQLKTPMPWADKKGRYQKKNLTFLRRQCKEYNIPEEDAREMGADYVLRRIVNLDECEDGIYEIVTCNESHDFAGWIDDYDYRLVPANNP